MLKQGQQLLSDHHVMRFVPWSKLRRDGDDNVLGFLPVAFELRPTEEAISVNWLEYFPGDHQNQVTMCVGEFRDRGILTIGKKSAFGVANVRKVRDICNNNGRAIRIVYSPTPKNSHTLIQKLPRDEFALYETLAVEAFTEIIMNTQVPFGDADLAPCIPDVP